jgi:hypothetical protein
LLVPLNVQAMVSYCSGWSHLLLRHVDHKHIQGASWRLLRTHGVRNQIPPWTRSPVAGGERGQLDRRGGQVTLANSIVRNAHGIHFEQHSHGSLLSG